MSTIRQDFSQALHSHSEIAEIAMVLRVRGRVVWSGSKEPTGFHELGVEFDSAAPDFWGDQYDPQSENVPHPTT